MVKKFSILFISIAVVVAGVFLLGQQNNVSIFAKKEEIKINENVAFLLLGKTGKVIGWNQAPDLADAIMVIEYRPKIGAANIVSLPRDLFVNLDGEGFKLNEVLRRNKLKSLSREVYEMTGIEAENYIVIDIDFLKKAVDELGGIDVQFDTALVDWVSGYKIEAGKQHLNGEQTAWAVRNRFAPEGDFFREKNQQKIISAVIDKFKSLSSLRRTAFLFKIIPEANRLETNMDFQKFTNVLNNFENARINNVVLDFSTGFLISSSTPVFIGDGSSTTEAYILLPREGADNYSAIKDFVQGKLEK